MNKPVVYISNYNGRMGNHMFQFAWAMSLAKKLDYGVCVPGISSKPEDTTGSKWPKTNGLLGTPPTEYVYIGIVDAERPYWHRDGYTNVEEFRRLHYGENIRGNSYFQNYQNFKENKEEIKSYFELPYVEGGKNKLGLHLRLTDHPNQYRPTMDYYFDSIESSDLSDVLIFTDQPDHQCISEIKNRYKGTQVATGNEMEDLALLASCDEMVMSRSTYSWWAGFLGYSKKVYFPETTTGFFSSGFWVDDDDRYIKIKSD